MIKKAQFTIKLSTVVILFLIGLAILAGGYVVVMALLNGLAMK